MPTQTNGCQNKKGGTLGGQDGPSGNRHAPRDVASVAGTLSGMTATTTVTFRLPLDQVDAVHAMVENPAYGCKASLVGAGTIHPVGLAEIDGCSDELRAALLELGAVDQTDGAALGELVGRTLASTPGLDQSQISNAYRVGLAMANFQAGLVAGNAGLEEADLREYMTAYQRALYGNFT
jgi:hypothetical protein